MKYRTCFIFIGTCLEGQPPNVERIMLNEITKLFIFKLSVNASFRQTLGRKHLMRTDFDDFNIF